MVSRGKLHHVVHYSYPLWPSRPYAYKMQVLDTRDLRNHLVALFPFTDEQTEAHGASMVSDKGMSFGLKWSQGSIQF